MGYTPIMVRHLTSTFITKIMDEKHRRIVIDKEVFNKEQLARGSYAEITIKKITPGT